MDLAQFVELACEAKTDAELYRLLEDVLRHECGYDRVIFSLMSDHPSLGLDAGHGVMRNYPEGWMKHYIENGYEQVDPVRRFGFRHVGPFIWDALPLVMNLAPEQELCMNECRDAGFYNGAAVLLRGCAGEMGGIGVAMSSRAKADAALDVKRKLLMLNVITQAFYGAFCALHARPRDTRIEEVVLTEKTMKVLEQLVLAKNDKVIAHELGMTKSAVDYHVRNILGRFKVNNRQAAVIKAVQCGIVGLERSAVIRHSQ